MPGWFIRCNGAARVSGALQPPCERMHLRKVQPARGEKPLRGRERIRSAPRPCQALTTGQGCPGASVPMQQQHRQTAGARDVWLFLRVTPCPTRTTEPPLSPRPLHNQDQLSSSPIHTRIYFRTRTLEPPEEASARMVRVASARHYPLPRAGRWVHVAEPPHTCPWSNYLVLKDATYSVPLLMILTNNNCNFGAASP